MKEYYCPLSKTKKCKFGGNKRYDYGFMQGTSNYCYKDKKFIEKETKCHLEDNKIK